MTFSIPAVDQLGWGEPLQNHLAQLNDPEMGGLNHVLNVAERDSKFWPDGATDKDEYVNKTVYVANTGTFHVWNIGSDPTTNRKWRELNQTLRTVINPHTSGFNTWENIEARPWPDGDTTHDDDFNFTGYNKQLGFFEVWSPSPINGWIPLSNFRRVERKNGVGQIQSNIANARIIELVNANGKTWADMEIREGTTLYIGAETGYVDKILTPTTLTLGGDAVEWHTDTFLGQNVTGTGTINVTKGSNVITAVSNVNFVTAGYSVGDYFYIPSNSNPYGTISSVTATELTLSGAVSTFSGHRTNYQIVKKLNASNYQYETANLSGLNSDNKNQLYTTSEGITKVHDLTFNTIYGFKAQTKDYTGSAYLGVTAIVPTGSNLNSMYGITSTALRTSSDLETGETFENGGTLQNLLGVSSQVGHLGDVSESTTTNNLYAFNASLYFQKGTINNAYGFLISAGGTSDTGSVANLYPIYENVNTAARGANIRNFFKNKVGINWDNTGITNILEVGGNIMATGTITPGSDKRWKSNINPIENPLASLAKLTGVTYYWNKEEQQSRDSDLHIGLIAQDALDIPGAVKTNEEGYLHLDYMGLVGLLVETNKELLKKVQVLEEKIAILESK